MKRYTAPIIFIWLAILFAVLLMPYTAEPEIYAISNVEGAGIFKNPIALKQISQEKTADLQPLMQDFLGSSGTIVLNVRLNNFEDAQEDLAEYRRAASQFDRLVINLDMSESEIGEFRKNNAENIRNLEELLNDSIAFDELNRLEIQYQNEDNPEMMYSIAYEGEALREKITQEFGQYQKNTAAMAKTGRAIEVDPEAMESSVDHFADHIREIEGRQEERIVRASDTAITFNEELTLATNPSGGIYGDGIHAAGVYSRTGDIPTGEPVTLYIDSREFAVSACTNTGEYGIPFTIHHMYAGTHLVYTRAGNVFSPIIPVSVAGTAGVLTLNVSVMGSTVLSSGRLTTECRDVSDAPVTIYLRGLDNETETTVYTDSSGAYSYETEVRPGDYIIQSVFSDPGFPVNECRSRESVVSVGQNDLLLYLLLFTIVAAGAGYLILRRRYNNREKEGSPEETSEPDTTEEHPSTSPLPERAEDTRGDSRSEATAIQDFRSRYISQRTTLSPADASRILGEGLTAAIGFYTGQKCRPSETMREQADRLEGRCREQAYVFVTMYEAMVYGKYHQKGDELLVAWDEAIRCMGAA
ncbi:carboxypeptidase-like regulatory domain-containing protein [Methanogenium sp. MK-MG]|uniref:carboxypeptidase-like regulatory domain-containing protein n=1 Tax=Methanogenium sp. MK-MG TaxID=2599926 RepID=UPI0013E9BC07|nr:carboxypeptidase-like regulatory domain-containing protein [Methanogenium sp. MK-MG]KAF1078612.1 hypothetical protein MKMG_00466 [Methanogenium sp. MK-MG]